METKNMAKGLHQIFVSRIMTLIGTILGALGGSVVLAIAMVTVNQDADYNAAMAGFAGMTAAMSVIFFVGLALLVLGTIFTLVGLGNASKDDARFKTVLIFALISLACSIISSILQAIPMLAQLLKIFSTALDLVVILLTIAYAAEALTRKGRADLAEKGLNIQKLILVIILITLIVDVIIIFPTPVTAILSIVVLILQIVYWFSFMIFLSKASKALA